jgi:16S rRNA processing protein RimM
LTRQPGEPRTPASGAPDGVPAGRVGRPHGLDGSFYVTRPRPRLLSVGVRVAVAGRSTRIVRRAGTEQRPIVRLEGVESRPAVEVLRGMELLVADADAPVLGEGEWWAHELEGCAVVGGEALLGTVSRLVELPSCEVLEVEAADGGQAVLVPMVRDAVLRVEPARRRIEVDLEFLGAADRALAGLGAPDTGEGRAGDGGADDGGADDGGADDGGADA